jgi:uncharacterized membrane protein YfcA
VNWFQKHLHWTLTIFFALSMAISAIIGSQYGFLNYNYESGIDMMLVGTVIHYAINFPVTYWVLRQKEQNVAWSLLVILNPIGFIVALLLTNKRRDRVLS